MNNRYILADQNSDGPVVIVRFLLSDRKNIQLTHNASFELYRALSRRKNQFIKRQMSFEFRK